MDTVLSDFKADLLRASHHNAFLLCCQHCPTPVNDTQAIRGPQVLQAPPGFCWYSPPLASNIQLAAAQGLSNQRCGSVLMDSASPNCQIIRASGLGVERQISYHTIQNSTLQDFMSFFFLEINLLLIQSQTISFILILKFLENFYCSIVDLQCCVSFRYTAK